MGACVYVSGHKSLYSLRRHCVFEDSASWLTFAWWRKPLAWYSRHPVRHRFRYLNLSNISAKSSPSSDVYDARTACTKTANLLHKA
jgi:hypothetical protein